MCIYICYWYIMFFHFYYFSYLCLYMCINILTRLSWVYIRHLFFFYFNISYVNLPLPYFIVLTILWACLYLYMFLNHSNETVLWKYTASTRFLSRFSDFRCNDMLQSSQVCPPCETIPSLSHTVKLPIPDPVTGTQSEVRNTQYFSM